MMLRRFISLLLALIMLGTLSVWADDEPWISSEGLTEDAELSTGYFTDSDRQAEHYVTYQPGGNITPILWYGSVLGEKQLFDEAAAQVEAMGKRVIAGTNGDYYVLSTGQPVGLVIREGVLASSDGGNPALGFLQDGSVFFGTPALQMSLNIQGETYRLAGINKPLHSGDFFLYTSDYGTETPVRTKTRNLILIPEPESDLRVGAELTLRVESNYWSPGAIPLSQNRWVICLTGDSDDWRQNALELLSKGDTITLRITAEDPRWSECTYASGSLYKLITDGEVCAELDKADATRAPRTAIGIREDGTVLLYTVDGRQKPYSTGLTLSETAERLLSLGCIEAGALDGGGSTVLHAQSAGEEDTPTRNSPSMGREREVSTYLFLVTEGESSGTATTLSVRCPGEALLCGGSMQFQAGLCDEKGSPVPASSIRWFATAGEIHDDGLFIAPEQGGLVEVSAESNGLRGCTAVMVVDTPDTIRILSQDSGQELNRLTLERGETVELSASATWGLLNIQAEDADFLWKCTGNAGSIDAEGLFSASSNGGNGTITVSAGEMSMTIGVAVKTAYTCVEDFEKIVFGSDAGLTWFGDSSMERVRYGSGSLRLDYNLDEGNAGYSVNWNEQEKAQYLYIWLFGDGSDNSLYAELDDSEIQMGTLEYNGWKLLTLDVQGKNLTRLYIRGQGSGTIWLDQAVVSNDPFPDLEPPQLELTTEGCSITAGISDIGDGYPDPALLRLNIDGIGCTFQYDTATGMLQAEVPDDGTFHRVTLLAWDRSGNYTTASSILAGETSSPFSDMDRHWAETYAAYLYTRGITSGKTVGEELQFDPNAPVTRAEFAVFLSRWLDLTATESETVTFADASDIPDWARDGVYAVAALGLIRGEQNGDTLWFKPTEPLTRAQAATILGRTMQAGSPYADLVYADAALIPDWAVDCVSRLAFLGVFSGFEDGTFRPGDSLTRAQAAKLLTEMS